MAKRPKKYLEGILVHDAKRQRIVIVLFPDIKGANPHDPRQCAIARAARRSGAYDAIVNKYRIYIRETKRSHWTRYTSDSVCTKLIQTFDTNGTFREGTVTLTAPRPYERLGVAQKRSSAESLHEPRIRSTERRLPRVIATA